MARIRAFPPLAGYGLLRVYYYDAPPLAGVLVNPIDQSRLDLSKHQHYSDNLSLQQSLEMRPDFALRQGELVSHGWALGGQAV